MSHWVDAVYRDPEGAVSVRLSIEDGIAFVRGSGVDRSAPLATLQIPAVNAPAPRIVRFSDGAYCAVADREAFDRLLRAGGRVPPTQWEGRPRGLGVVLLVLAVVLVAGVSYGIPFLASQLAAWVPERVTTQISDHTLAVLDEEMLRPSALSQERRAALTAAFSGLRTLEATAYRLEFRSSDELGANAAALPSGIIIVTDGLVRLAHDDREILGVLAHEAGHVARRHGTRLLLQRSALTVAVGWLLGDLSSVAAAAPAILLQSKYSRDLEREADESAADVLRANGIPPSRLADLLERLDAHERQRTGAAEPVLLLDYVASHPATEERLAYLRGR